MGDTNGSELDALARAARRLGRRAAVASPLPTLWFFTDPARVPEPERVVERLPSGAGVVFRHFGAPDRFDRAQRLARIAAARGLTLLIGNDPELVDAIGAAGVHLPERRMSEAADLRRRRPAWRLTAAAHSSEALRRADALRLDGVFVSPVFTSRSSSAGPPLGPGRLRHWASRARTPVYALGGVNGQTVRRLRGTGVAGIAAVDALSR